jgi:hypothetical protein
MPQLIARMPVTILVNASLSAAVEVRGGLISVIEMPAAWTAASLTFQTSGDGTNFFNLYDEFGAEVTLTADAARRIRLEPTQWAGINSIKIRSGTAGAPAVQLVERNFFIEIWE